MHSDFGYGDGGPIQGKVPGAETGIDVRKTICAICAATDGPGPGAEVPVCAGPGPLAP